MVSWQCLSPFTKHSDETAIFQMLHDLIQWEIGEPSPSREVSRIRSWC